MKPFFMFFIAAFLLSSCFSTIKTRSHSSVSRDPNDSIKYIQNIGYNDNTGKPNDPLLVILWKYSPDTYYFVKRMDDLPKTFSIGNRTFNKEGKGNLLKTFVINGKKINKMVPITITGFRSWIDEGSSFDEQIGNLTPSVHEIMHGYNSDYANYLFSKRISDPALMKYQNGSSSKYANYVAYYINKDKTVVATRRYVYSKSYYVRAFPAREIVSLVPQKNRLGRFKPYILGNYGPQHFGITGLLDEYNAYYWSSRVAYDLYNYYKNKNKHSVEMWAKWIDKINFFVSYAEFRYFILTYLIYAEKHHHEMYKSFIADENLRNAFTAIDDSYSQLVTNIFFRLKKEMPEDLKAKGIKVTFKKGYRKDKSSYTYIILKKGNSFRSAYVSTNTCLILREAMLKPDYKKMAEKFRLMPGKELPDFIVH